MNLGIFGDSYVDINGDTDHKSWPNLCKKRFEKYHIEGRCGVSHWYTYQKFLVESRKQKFTHIIFSHTAPHRWPSLPEELDNNHWNIHSLPNASYSETLGTLNKFYPDLFPVTLTEFISENIFRNINEYCKNNNIYLVNIINFRQGMFEYKTDFPILYDIDSISHLEKITYKNKSYTFLELVKEIPMPDGDPRICHFGWLNNARLANTISQLLDNKSMNVIFDMSKDFIWDIYDKDTDIIFQRILEQKR